MTNVEAYRAIYSIVVINQFNSERYILIQNEIVVVALCQNESPFLINR